MREQLTTTRGALMAALGAGAVVLAGAVLLLARSSSAQADRFPYRDARLPVDVRVRDLLGRMTLEEKFWQLFMIPGDLDDPSHDYSLGVFGLQIGTKPGIPSHAALEHAVRINLIQRRFVEGTRLGIPIIPFDEAVHGLTRDGATVFPQAIALAATLDRDLMSRVATAIARETHSRGIRQVLSPVVNLADDVRWGRVEETYGEDPYLVSEMARAFVSVFEQAGILTRTQALRRERRRGRARQLPHRPQRAARVRLMWDADDAPGRQAIDDAAALARRSDAAIVVAGIEEGEFRDRAFLSLPGRQDELIEAVAATGTPVVVIIIGGSAVTMTRWLNEVDAVIDAWYPGEQGGRAVAGVIFGDANPAGRLPITFPLAEGQLPLRYDHKPTGRGDDYVDLSGQPLFPFGYGLSYTTFECGGLRIEPATIGPSDTATVRFTVRNTGARAGDEVAQRYLRDVLASVARPVMALRAFARLRLAPGEAREVTLTLGPDDLGLLDEDLAWTVEPGTFVVMIGGSSKDIRLRGELVVR